MEIQIRRSIAIGASIGLLVLGGVVAFLLKPSGVPQQTYDQLMGSYTQAQQQSSAIGAERDGLKMQLDQQMQNNQTLQDQVGTLKSEVTTLRGTVSELSTTLKTYELDSQMLAQLRTFFNAASPFNPTPPGTVFHMLPDGTGLFLQFDAPPTQATRLLYWGQMVPGTFCNDDGYARLQVQGYVHFRAFSAPNESSASGGRPGEVGYWMRFIALDELEMPWGVVAPGVDFNYKPTEPPTCES